MRHNWVWTRGWNPRSEWVERELIISKHLHANITYSKNMRAKFYVDFCSIDPQVQQALISELQLFATKTPVHSFCLPSLRVGICTHRSGMIPSLSSTRRILGGFQPAGQRLWSTSEWLRDLCFLNPRFCLNFFALSNSKPKSSFSFVKMLTGNIKELWHFKMVTYHGNINVKGKYKHIQTNN